jgi:hypothetical protein
MGCAVLHSRVGRAPGSAAQQRSCLIMLDNPFNEGQGGHSTRAHSFGQRASERQSRRINPVRQSSPKAIRPTAFSIFRRATCGANRQRLPPQTRGQLQHGHAVRSGNASRDDFAGLSRDESRRRPRRAASQWSRELSAPGSAASRYQCARIFPLSGELPREGSSTPGQCHGWRRLEILSVRST